MAIQRTEAVRVPLDAPFIPFFNLFPVEKH
jgi:hypothetical protein